jgi:hypothetical protein
MLTAMVPTRAHGLEVLSFVAASGTAPQVVSSTAAATATPAAQKVRASGTATPLQLLQLGPIVFRAAGHASADDQFLLGHTCRSKQHMTLRGRFF